jgi:hypothetical protein
MHFFAPLDSYRLTAQMGEGVIFRIFGMLPGLLLLKGLRNDVLDVRMHISPQLMKCIPNRTAHVVHCSTGSRRRVDTPPAML